MNRTAYQKIKSIVGLKGIVEKEPDKESYVKEWRGQWQGHCDLVVRPKSTEEVSNIVKICSAAGIPVTPQSGNTGLVGGGVPLGGILLSVDRMDQIINVDRTNSTLTCEAGVILKNIQDAAQEVNRFFPLSLASEESCRISGNLATNAGGVHVLRYGNARDLVLGIEIVLPNGEIWNGLRSLRKDNTGYDLKHLFMGSEGTLGVITRCILKLFPKPVKTATAFVAMSSVPHIIDLFERFREFASETLSVFEYMNALSVELTVKNLKNNRYPFSENYPNFLLIELTSSNPNQNIRLDLESILSDSITDGIVANALLAENNSQRKDFWRIRETIPEAQNFEGGSIKNDISIPISNVSQFLKEADIVTSQILPHIRHVSFGHIGDGNIHYNLSQPQIMEKNIYLKHRDLLTNAINKIVYELGGSFSAEHGIGLLKRRELKQYRSCEEIMLMKTLKKTLDPNGIMNPGKIL